MEGIKWFWSVVTVVTVMAMMNMATTEWSKEFGRFEKVFRHNVSQIFWYRHGERIERRHIVEYLVHFTMQPIHMAKYIWKLIMKTAFDS